MDIKLEFFNSLKEAIENTYVSQEKKIKKVAKMFYDTIENDGVIQLFGVKHGQEFVNELNFRAGGLAPYHGLSLKELIFKEIITQEEYDDGSVFNRPEILNDMLSLYKLDDRDLYVLVSQYGNEPLLIELAKYCKEKGHTLVAVINKKSYDVAQPLHESGKKLLDFADEYLDMSTEEPDIALHVGKYNVGQLSSTVSNVMAQMITAEVYNLYVSNGKEAPILLSTNVKGADVHNNRLTNVYEGRVR